jgi:hypothetical protein
MNVREQLQGLRALLADQERWTRGALARDAGGRPVPPRSSDACCWCLAGGAEACALGADALVLLQRSARAEYGRSLAGVNDEHGYEAVERVIAAALDEAARHDAPIVNAGVAWLRDQGKPLSDFGERVAAFVDWWARGIYHLERDARRADWSTDGYLRLTLTWGSLATFDGADLTRLVVGAHDRAIRVELAAVAPHVMEVLFHPRMHGEERLSRRHPTMEEAIALVREAQQGAR